MKFSYSSVRLMETASEMTFWGSKSRFILSTFGVSTNFISLPLPLLASLIDPLQAHTHMIFWLLVDLNEVGCVVLPSLSCTSI